MKVSLDRTLLAGAAAWLLAGTAATPAAGTASLDLLARATNPNPTLNSYTASAKLAATLRAVIPVRKTFNGNVYYLRPNRKIEFQNVPGALSKFKDMVQTMPSYEQAAQQYAIVPQADNGSVSTYQLTPKKTGSRVKNLVVTITDATALMSNVLWNYNDGSTLAFAQTYESVGNYRLPATAQIAAHFPGYSVNGNLTFSNYQPGATVSPSVFTTQ